MKHVPPIKKIKKISYAKQTHSFYNSVYYLGIVLINVGILVHFMTSTKAF